MQVKMQSYQHRLACLEIKISSERYAWLRSTGLPLLLGMWQSQPKSVGCRFHVQNPSDAEADLSHDQNQYHLL